MISVFVEPSIKCYLFKHDIYAVIDKGPICFSCSKKKSEATQ